MTMILPVTSVGVLRYSATPQQKTASLGWKLLWNSLQVPGVLAFCVQFRIFKQRTGISSFWLPGS